VDNQQRTTQIANALVNGAATLEQMIALAEAVHASEFTGVEFGALSDEQKWALIPDAALRWAVGRIEWHAREKAVRAAAAVGAGHLTMQNSVSAIEPVVSPE
jgi:hypothetical protein